MTELLSAIFDARDRVLMLFILTIAVLLVTYMIYVISGRTGIIKYLPGLLLTGAGIYYLYRGFHQLTTHAGLNELMSAVMFVVIGLVGIGFALILGILHQGEGQKTKRRAQALDYLQEARSAEAVVYPERKKVDHAVDTQALRQQEEERLAALAAEQQKTREENERLKKEQEEKRKLDEEEAAKQAAERKKLADEERARAAARQARIDAAHAELLEREDARHKEQQAAFSEEMARREEEKKLARLEKELERKNAIRQDVLAYNQKAKELNEKENAGITEQLGLFFDRTRIVLKKWGTAVALKLRTGIDRLAVGGTRMSRGISQQADHQMRRLGSRSEAKKAEDDPQNTDEPPTA